MCLVINHVLSFPVSLFYIICFMGIGSPAAALATDDTFTVLPDGGSRLAVVTLGAFSVPVLFTASTGTSSGNRKTQRLR